MMPRLAIGLVIAFASSAGLAPAGGAVGQEPSAPNATPDPHTDVRWVLTGSPHVDLWYHGVAVVGFEGIGPLPLYDPEYTDRVRSARAETGASSSPLEANRDRFATAFARDSLFEFLHFLPLYFAFSNRVAMWDAIRTVAQGGTPGSVADPTARFGASATAYVLGEGERIALVGEFVDALDAEWEVFFDDHRRRLIAEQRDRLGRLQNRWNDEMAPALAPYLRSENLDRGLLLLSPAIGFEGRILQGDPRNPNDNVVVIHLDTSPQAADGELFAAVRELCFPLVRRVIEEMGTPVDRYEGERRSSFGAVRCGSLLLRRYVSGMALAYERHFLGTVPGASGQELADTRLRFDREFPISDDLARALAAAVAALPDR